MLRRGGAFKGVIGIFIEKLVSFEKLLVEGGIGQFKGWRYS
jgi:hypothetical protein